MNQLNGQQITLDNLHPKTTVEKIKDMLGEQMENKSEKIRQSYNQTNLINYKSLTSYGIVDKTEIDMSFY